MKIGIIGLGVVGSAIQHGFAKLGHDIRGHDIKHNTSIETVKDTDITFICVPTPSAEDGRADVSVVDSTVKELVENLAYQGIIAVKSTVEPGTTESLIEKYPNNKICFVPEFLRERCAIADFVENHDLCVIGTYSDEIYEIVQTAHGDYPRAFAKLSPTEAEIAKYYSNTYNAMLITFANAYYEICKKMGADYHKVKEAAAHRDAINNHYLDCNENLRGFGGVCLPKDTRAIVALIKKLGLDVDILPAILSDNEKYDTHLFDNMRESH